MFKPGNRPVAIVMVHLIGDGKPDQHPNLTKKKIPKAVLSRCEWGKDDHSLQVENLPKAPLPKGQFIIGGSGELEQLRLIRSSGSAVLDDEALRAVKAAAAQRMVV